MLNRVIMKGGAVMFQVRCDKDTNCLWRPDWGAPLPFQLTHSTRLSAGVCAVGATRRSSSVLRLRGPPDVFSTNTTTTPLWTMSDSPHSRLAKLLNHSSISNITTLVTEWPYRRYKGGNVGNLWCDVMYLFNNNQQLIQQWNSLLTKPGNIRRIS